MITINVPSVPSTPLMVVPVGIHSIEVCWDRYLEKILDAAWRERSITLDRSGNLILYARLSQHDRALLGIDGPTAIEEIWVATQPFEAEEVS